MKYGYKLLILATVLLLSAAVVALYRSKAIQQVEIAPTSTPAIVETPASSPNFSPESTTKTVQSAEITGIAAAHQFAITIPTDWQVEAIPAIEAVNVYDLRSAGNNNLDRSQLFIRYFKASQFLTLSTVTIHNRDEIVINDRPAFRYDIEKKASVPNFPNQPAWRNQRHTVTDISSTASNPTVFYVIAKNPELSEEVYQNFLSDFQITDR